MFLFDQPDPAGDARPRRRTAGLTIVALALTATAAFAVTRQADADQAKPPVSLVCGYAGSDDEAAREAALDLCRRKALDTSRRADLTRTGPVPYDGSRGLMSEAVLRAFHCRPVDAPCQGRQRPGTDADVLTARNALTAAGFPASVVRLAHRDDPAPDGSVVYALQVRDRCVVGSFDPASGDASSMVGGLLPNGRCLS